MAIFKAADLKAKADAATRVDPPAYVTLNAQMDTAAIAGGYTLTVATSTVTNRVLACLLMDNFAVQDLGTGNTKISWQ